jgi:hypothetical protein
MKEQKVRLTDKAGKLPWGPGVTLQSVDRQFTIVLPHILPRDSASLLSILQLKNATK